MGCISFGRKLGLSLAALAIGSMTLLQVNPSYAATNSQSGTRVDMVLSQGQLASLARQDYALYKHVLEAYRSNSQLVVTQRQYQLLSHLKTAYLSYARAGQTACAAGMTMGANGQCQVTIPAPTKSGTAASTPTPSGPLGPLIAALTASEGAFTGAAAFFPPLAAVPPIVIVIVVVLTIINDLILLFQPPTAPAK